MAVDVELPWYLLIWNAYEADVSLYPYKTWFVRK